jgi:hypothetical protein
MIDWNTVRINLDEIIQMVKPLIRKERFDYFVENMSYGAYEVIFEDICQDLSEKDKPIDTILYTKIAETQDILNLPIDKYMMHLKKLAYSDTNT